MITLYVRILALLTLSVTAIAQSVQFTEFPETVETGKSYTIDWSPAVAASILLRKGSSSDLKVVSTLVTGRLPPFFWTVPESLEAGDDYALEIQTLGEQINFSGYFKVVRGSGKTPASSDQIQSTSLVTSASPPRSSSEVVTTAPSVTKSSDATSPTPTPSSIPDTSSTASNNSGPNSSTFTTQTSSTTPPQLSETGTSAPIGQGLSTGAKAGIGVGATLGGLALVLGGLFLGIVVRRRKNAGAKDQESSSYQYVGKPELDGQGIQVGEKPELDGTEISSAEVKAAIELRHEAELEGTGGPQNLAVLGYPPVSPVRGDIGELDGRERPQELADIGQAPVSPVQNEAVENEASDLDALKTRNTKETGPQGPYEHPQLIENPWAQGDAPQR
ncbi:hypothetical protein P154DRAFT_618743 [Amniculicola lignicola CBS 123094]|uniref:Yeast cell wall synthesis Kre9/Knh1-like N-terminal domain-containing protein n=1 Tax=Amniculicola lignicola CBS 123094 TaxID=1392246 RepID=A0A6A5WN83_9PLEO|nr:hypothetical protein P154DRAFT_618743 [Amniculicola lignicola CBS 123094]